MRVNLQPAFILHTRHYRDSSLLLEVLTAEYGRLSLVARGARRKTRGGSAGALLQPFTPLLLSFSGRAEMKTLVATEAVGQPPALRGERVFSAMYLNELLMRLLHRHDPHPQLFATYGQTLDALSTATEVDVVLRHFEFTLLHELGYGFDLGSDGRSAEVVAADCWYHFHPDYGLVEREGTVEAARPAYAGVDLLAMAAGEFGGRTRQTAKRLLRQALAVHLGEAPLRSRDLFRTRAARPDQIGDGVPAGAGTDGTCAGDAPTAGDKQ